MTTEHFDVLIVGAGLSGIAAGYYLQTRCPRKTYAILEGRDALGGTWDLFRYPGIRSDSDMYTLGYTFRPWQSARAIVDGPSILNYLRETAAEYGIDKKIRFGHRVCRVSWSSAEARWTVDVQHDGQILQLTCNFLFMCTGYYTYDKGYTPEWNGVERFQGQIIHPQAWPQDFDYTGKRIIVIGSGATAVTLIPALAEKAAHVTMLQRSPTYIVSAPSEDAAAEKLRRFLPGRMAYAITRWKHILLSMYYFYIARSRPDEAKAVMIQGVRAALGPDFDVETHFTPRYKPWDQRVCLVPDSDLFNAINAGKVSVVTGEIETFVESGIQLKSGEILPAGVIITATGLVMKIMHGVQIIVDGKPVELSDTVTYKGMMYSSIPNLASAFGYANASWTLKAELICIHVCRLLNYMDRRGYNQCMPRIDDPAFKPAGFIDFTSGYVQRALNTLPQQGTKRPWKAYQNYLKDLFIMRFAPLNDGAMRFKKRDTPR